MFKGMKNLETNFLPQMSTNNTTKLMTEQCLKMILLKNMRDIVNTDELTLVSAEDATDGLNVLPSIPSGTSSPKV